MDGLGAEGPERRKVTQRSVLRALVFAVFGQMRWMAAAVPLVLTLVLGSWGFSTYGVDGNPTLGFPDNVYQTLLLFFFASGYVTGPLPWPLEIARWMAPALLAWATIKAILFLARRELMIMRLRTWRDHAVLAGDAHELAELAQALDIRTCLVDTSDDTEEVAETLDGGVPVIGSLLAQERAFTKLNLHGARHVLFMDRSDDANIARAMRLRDILAQAPAPAQPLICHVHIADPVLEQVLSEQEVFAHASAAFDARLFNLARNHARRLFDAHGPDIARPIRGSGDAPAHVVIVGFGALGSRILTQALRTGHYANEQRLVVTIIDTDGARDLARFRASVEQLEVLADIDVLDADAGALTRDSLAQIEQRAPVSTAFICAGGDALRLHLAMHLRDRLDAGARVVACLRRRRGFRMALRDGTQFAFRGRAIHLFTLADARQTGSDILHEDVDVIARGIHDAYRAHAGVAIEPWERLSSELKDSNRFQADHIAVKLRAIGCACRAEAPAAAHAFTDAELDTMARMEHRRWMSDKLLAGWRDGVPAGGGAQDRALKIHTSLVPYDELPASEQQKDVDAVREIPVLLAAHGRFIHTLEQP